MSTRLYLRDSIAEQAGRPVGSATTDGDNGHAGVARLICLTLSKQKGAAETAATASCVAHAAGTQDLLRVFMSPALTAQTLAAGSGFTVAGGFDQCVTGDGGGEYENACLRFYVYLWRPGVGWVCGLCGDGAGRSGYNDPSPVIADPYPPRWQVVALPALAAEVEVRLRDRVVLEVWQYRAATVTTTAAFGFNGGDDALADGEVPGAEGPASYVEYSGDLILAREVSMNSADILVGARDLQVDGSNVGALDGGVTVTYDPKHIEHTVDQRLGVQRVDKIAERMTITANLKEATLENLRIAWGQPTAALSTAGTKTTLHVGGDDTVTEHTLILTGKAPGTNRTRTITCHLAVAIETSAHAYTKEGATVYPVTFVLVEDATQGEGFKYMTIEDDEGQFVFA